MFKLLYKPKNISSFQFINQFKKENLIKKIGHSGTLDPAARGLLLVGTNEDTKLIRYLNVTNKTYLVTAQLGILTPSFDLDTPVIKTKKTNVSLTQLKDVLNEIQKTTSQLPPLFSAKHYNGQRAYKLARQNINVELPPQAIKIFSINLKSFKKDLFQFEVTVSKGTYIRTLVHDIGIKLNSYATLVELERIKIGFLGLDLLNQELIYNQILKIPVVNLKEVLPNRLLKLKNGNNDNLVTKSTTLFTYQNKPIVIIKEKSVIKVFPTNINTFL